MKKTKFYYLPALMLVPLFVIGVLLGWRAQGAALARAQAPEPPQESVTVFFYNNLGLTNLRVAAGGGSASAMIREAPASDWYFADIEGDLARGVFVVFSGTNERGQNIQINGVVIDDGMYYFSIAGRFGDRASAQIGSGIAPRQSANTALIVLAVVFTVLGAAAAGGAVIYFFAGKKKMPVSGAPAQENAEPAVENAG